MHFIFSQISFLLVRSTIGTSEFLHFPLLHAVHAKRIHFLQNVTFTKCRATPPAITPPPLKQAAPRLQSMFKTFRFLHRFFIVFSRFRSSNWTPKSVKITKKSPPIQSLVLTPFFHGFCTKRERPGPSKT